MIRLPKGSAKTEIRKDYIATTALTLPQGRHVPVQTVHAVKGETHDLTVFVCPDPAQKNRCPSVVWWSNDDSDAEERRIAFVAVTRTRGIWSSVFLNNPLRVSSRIARTLSTLSSACRSENLSRRKGRQQRPHRLCSRQRQPRLHTATGYNLTVTRKQKLELTWIGNENRSKPNL